MTNVNPYMLDAASDAFDAMVQERHNMGAEKYGPVKFMEIDSIEMALEEVADLANYARYTFIKLWLLRETLTVPPQGPLGADAITNPFKGE